jgi:hypothetical protein
MWFMKNDAATDFIKDLNANPDRYPDRVVGIVLGVIIDERLSDTIGAHTHKDKKITEDIFEINGILGNAGARIPLGFMIGLYGSETNRDLTLFTKIRNAFAHRLEIASFDDSPVRDWVDQLRLPDKEIVFNNGGTIWNLGNPVDLKPKNRRGRFVRTAQMLNAAFFIEIGDPATNPKRAPRF